MHDQTVTISLSILMSQQFAEFEHKQQHRSCPHKDVPTSQWVMPVAQVLCLYINSFTSLDAWFWENFLGPPSGSGFVTTSHYEDIHMISITRQSELKDSLQYSDLIDSAREKIFG
jgi:hypothetical protein